MGKRGSRSRMVVGRVGTDVRVVVVSRVRLLVLAFAFGLLAAVAAADDASKPSVMSAGDPSMAAARERASERLARQETMAARDERADSRSAFGGLDDAAARGLARDRFPGLMRAKVLDAREPGEGLRVVKMRSPRVAVVEDVESKRKFVSVSSFPLETTDRSGGRSPVDLALESVDGGFRSRNPLADVLLASDAPSVRFASSGVRIDVVGAPAGGGVMVDDRVFFGNVDRDTDAFFVPTPGGAEVSWQLRSQASPERLALSVDMPAGAQLRRATTENPIPGDPPRAYEIVRGEEKLGFVQAPIAFDADGTPVSVEMVKQGEHMLVLTVTHRDRDVRYPLIVDPELQVSDVQGSNYDGWQWSQERLGGAYTFGVAISDPAYGNALYTSMPTNSVFKDGAYAQFYFRAPPATLVHRVRYYNWQHDPTYYYSGDGAGQWVTYSAGFNGIMNSAYSAWEQPVNYVNGTGQTGPNPWWGDFAVSGAIHDYCHVPRCDQGQGEEQNYALFGLQAYNRYNNNDVGTLGDRAWSIVANTDVFLGDRRVPVITSAVPAGGWSSQSGPRQISVSAHDDGVGLDEIVAYDGAGAPVSAIVPDGSHPFLQPADHSAALSVPITEGWNQMVIQAYDIVGNASSEQAWEVGLDQTAPKLTVEGGIWGLNNHWLPADEYVIDVFADDLPSDPANQTIDTSGVRKAELVIDGAVTETKTQPCAFNCSFETTLTVRPATLTAGAHSIAVRVTDGAGITTQSQTISVQVPAGRVVTPQEGQKTPRRLSMEAATPRSGYSTVTWQYRRTDADLWTVVPLAYLRDEANRTPSSTALPLTAGKTAPVSWDMPATPALNGADGTVQVRGQLSGSAGTGYTQVVKAELDQKGLESKTAREGIGPGQVNLITGNFALGEDDVTIDSFASDLTLSRTYNSRDAGANPNGMFGPGWTSSVPVTGSEYARVVDKRVTDPSSIFVYLVLPDGSEVAFTQGATGLKPEPGADDLSLTKTASGYTLQDLDGVVTTFTVSGSNASWFLPSGVQQPTNATRTTYVTGAVAGGSTQVLRAFAPVRAGVDCATAFVAGCRSLEFVYASSTTPGLSSTVWGDVTGRVVRVDFKAYDPATSAITTDAVVRYQYDNAGRLRAAWDPRITPTLKTTYDYDAGGLLTTLTPPGEDPWSFGYLSLSGDPAPGRLRQVSRSALDQGTARWTVAYRVPISGAGAPYAMGTDDVAGWAQTDVPTDATAIFPPDQVPANPPTAYSRAEVHYLNREGYESNVAAPGGRIETSEHDRYGNVVRELTAANRVRALAAANPPVRAAQIDTRRQFQSDGLRMVDEVGPLHRVRLASGEDVDAREHTVVAYDEGAPATIDGKPAGAFHLPTTSSVAAQIGGRADADVRVTKTEYDWKLRTVTSTTEDAGAGGLALVRKVVLDPDTGLEVERRMPSQPAGGDASATKTVLFTEAANATHPECGGKGHWYGLVCKTTPVVQPGTAGLPALPVTTFTYNRLNQVLTQTDVSGTKTRATTSTYDEAGRELTGSVTANEGTSLPTVTTSYDPATGRATGSSAVIAGTTRQLLTAYDPLGRVSSYTDADANTSTTTYDLLGRAVTTTDGKGSQTRSYDAVTEDLTRLEDSAAGVFEASYDADGSPLTEKLPNGLTATTTYDESGSATVRAYDKTSQWLRFAVKESIHGQWLRHDGTLSTQDYAYDGAGRLTEVRDTPAAQGCTVRRYTLDRNSNRTRQETHNPGGGNVCDTAGADLVGTRTVDAADRIKDAGYVYDAMGRITSLPAKDAGGGVLSSSYYVNDLVRSQQQDGRTNTYDLDPGRRTRLKAVTGPGAVNEVHHYADGSDSPAWIDEAAGSEGRWRRNIEGIGGDLVGVQDSVDGVTLQLTNLHGDVVATAATDSTKAEPVQTLTGTADLNGNFTATGIASLPPGKYQARVEQTDAAGNRARGAAMTFQVDPTASAQPDLRSTILADGATGYWRLGETSGTAASDERGSYPATYTRVTLGQPSALPGDTNPSALFDAVEAAATVTDPTKLNFGGGDFTAVAWIKTTVSSYDRAFIAKGGPEHATGWTFAVTDDAGHQGQLRGEIKTLDKGAQVIYSTTRVDDGAWHQVGLAVSRTSGARIYLDGTQVGYLGGISTLPVDNAATFQLGQASPSLTGVRAPRFVGQVDEAAVYTSALSGWRITRQYEIAHAKDTTAPAPTITAPAAGGSVSGRPVFSGTASGLNSDAATVRVSIYRGTTVTNVPYRALTATRSGSTWSVASLRSLPPGSYLADVAQHDVAGNEGRSALIPFTVATAAPDVDYRAGLRADTPLAYWRLAEAAGATVAADDMSAFPADATGGVTFGIPGAIPAVTNTAARFDGSDDAVTVSDPLKLDMGTGDFSAEGWVRSSPDGLAVEPIVGKWDGLASGWQLVVDGANVSATVKTTLATVTVKSDQRVDDGTWHHVALVKQAGTVNLYVDGTLARTGSGTLTTGVTSTAPLRIGRNHSSTGSDDLDEIAVYNKALSASDLRGRVDDALSGDTTAPSTGTLAQVAASTDATPTFTGTTGIAAGDQRTVVVKIYPDTSSGPLATFENTEYGVPRPGSQHRENAWLGTKQRSTELPSGVIEMGVRSYVPALGRFLQVDPVLGGAANAYDYALQDPVNTYDLDGRCITCVLRALKAVKGLRGKLKSGGRHTKNLTRSARGIGLGGAISTIRAIGRSLRNTEARVHVGVHRANHRFSDGLYYRHIQVRISKPGTKGSGRTVLNLRIGRGLKKKANEGPEFDASFGGGKSARVGSNDK